MIFEKYEYKYALIPHAEAKKMGLGWRKADADGMVLMNMSEIKQLEGDGTVEERVAAMGGRVMTPEEANYYRHTNNFSFVSDKPKEEEKPTVEPLPEQIEEIDPGFSRDPIPEAYRGAPIGMKIKRKNKKQEQL